MYLEVWKGDWDLPSIDLECLQIMAYAKFSAAPLDVKKTNNPWKSKKGSLPVMTTDDGLKLYTFLDMMSSLKLKGFNPDFDLTSIQCSEAIACSMFLKEKLHPALLHSFWCDNKNYVEFIRPWYAKALPFPLNYFVPGRMQSKALGVVDAVYCNRKSEKDTDLQFLILENAKECFSFLSKKLGSRPYIFGDKPTSLDATIFAYLAPILKVPLPNAFLKKNLEEYENLLKYVTRILRSFPSEASDDMKDGSKSKNKNKKADADDEEFPHRIRNQILSVLFAVAAMTTYSLFSGLVSMKVITNSSRDNDEYIDNYDEFISMPTEEQDEEET